MTTREIKAWAIVKEEDGAFLAISPVPLGEGNYGTAGWAITVPCTITYTT